MDDYELLQGYAARGDEDAFRTLTDRYLRLVYSAAVRQTGNASLAEDVTQAVFLTLARKARAISPKVILPGWLLRTTRYAAANARRLEQRRQQYEEQAMNAQLQTTETDAAWQRIAPLLDEAVDVLPAKDRDAVVLRFFEGMSLRAVAERLGVSEDGAQKRVSRAVERLRVFFEGHGRAVSAGALMAAIAGNATQAAPANVAMAASQIATAIGQATITTLARIRLQILAIRAGSIALLIGVAMLPILRLGKPPTNVAPMAQAFSEPESPPFRNEPAVSTAITPQTDLPVLLLRVEDSQTGAPVANARLTLVSSDASSSRTTNIFRTDAKGVGVIRYSPDPVRYWSHRIEIFRDGYVPKFVSWSEYQQDGIDEIPAEYTARVDPAVKIGGAVLDEQGAPVPGARVVFSVSGPTQSRSRERLTMMGSYHTEVTGADGSWSCSHVPARFGMISFKAIHPQFQEKSFISDSPDAPNYSEPNRIAESDFLAGRATMRLERGLLIAGIVTDENGQPIAEAQVTQNYSFRDPERSTTTDGAGSFRFENGRSRELALTIQAHGFAPVVTSFVMNASAEQLRLVLPPGHVLHGRVVDETGQGIAGASISAASPRYDSSISFEWRTKSDAEGRFWWDTAPAVQEYAVNASGYEYQSRVKLAADGTEQIVRLNKRPSIAVVRIHGQLLDADTRQAVPGGSIQIWQTSREYQMSTTRAETVGPDGKFRLRTSSGTLSYVLEAQAQGYWPLRLTNRVVGDGEIWLDLQLNKAPVVDRIVLTPLGKPAQGATVVVCGRDDRAYLNRLGRFQLDQYGSTASALADAQGRFRLPSKHGPEAVFIAHPEGFGEFLFWQVVSNATVVLQPWGRIEGVATSGGKALVGERIQLAPRNHRTHVVLIMSANTGAEGRFTFDSVPPGSWKVQREINRLLESKSGARMPLFSHGTIVEVKAGETANVVLGGNGRAVFGRAISPQTVDADVWTQNSIALIQKEAPAEYRAMFHQDGSFRIDDVPPGEYTLRVDLAEPPSRADGNSLKFKPIASLQTAVRVSADSHSDLGLLELLPR
jgi:RNA polymerase sigma factor (sigma-70 family)